MDFTVVGGLGLPNLQTAFERLLRERATGDRLASPRSATITTPTTRLISHEHAPQGRPEGLHYTSTRFIFQKYSGIIVSAPPRVASTGIPYFLANSPWNGLLPGR